jgi:NAD(P)H-hydrate repair Nnr-like enzyme with NAD(P)H-hydrate epimerase domain
MLHVFKTGLDHRLSRANLPASVAQSLQTQSIKLAAIDIPQNLNAETRQMIRGAIDQSFVFGFRWVMVIGAALAAGSAVTALFWIEGAPAARSVEKRSAGGR